MKYLEVNRHSIEIFFDLGDFSIILQVIRCETKLLHLVGTPPPTPLTSSCSASSMLWNSVVLGDLFQAAFWKHQHRRCLLLLFALESQNDLIEKRWRCWKTYLLRYIGHPKFASESWFKFVQLCWKTAHHPTHGLDYLLCDRNLTQEPLISEEISRMTTYFAKHDDIRISGALQIFLFAVSELWAHDARDLLVWYAMIPANERNYIVCWGHISMKLWKKQ